MSRQMGGVGFEMTVKSHPPTEPRLSEASGLVPALAQSTILACALSGALATAVAPAPGAVAVPEFAADAFVPSAGE